MTAAVVTGMEDGRNRGGGLRVAIIGAGVSGLVACKQCSEQGLDATVFEGKSGLGGVWRASYSSTKLQTPKGAYAFSDFPWPESVPTFPSHHQVVDYLESYARHFGFLDRIRFNSQIVEVKKKVQPGHSHNMGTSESTNRQSIGEGEGGELLESLIKKSQNEQAGDSDGGNVIWEVCVRKKVPGSEGLNDYFEEWMTFDFLIMCCGRFGDIARLPSFPMAEGPDVFDGQVLHALDYSALDSKSTQAVIRGKKVVVVGFQKTSLDVAVEVAEINEGLNDVQPCTLLFRRAHWMFPRHRKAFGLFPFGYLFGTRLSEYWTPKPGQGLLQSLLQAIFSPVRWLVWKLLEYYLRFNFLSQYGLVPEQSLLEDVSACVLPQLPQNLLGHLGEGRIVLKKTPHWKFYEKGVRLADGTDIDADVVILCTGYNGNSKLKAILPEEDRAIVFEPEGVLALYRGIIHPQIQNMGFIGYLEGLSSVHSAEIAAVWLTQVLRRRVTLPDIATMETDRRSWLQHWKTTTPFFARSVACVSWVQIWHVDKLCKDMGVKSLRKKTWWEEVFSIYGNSDYRSLTSEL